MVEFSFYCALFLQPIEKRYHGWNCSTKDFSHCFINDSPWAGSLSGNEAKLFSHRVDGPSCNQNLRFLPAAWDMMITAVRWCLQGDSFIR